MGTSKKIELERKFAADMVTEIGFQLWCEQHKPLRTEATGYPDCYYRRGTSVVRHRHSGGAGELTVKQRTSPLDPTKRVEIDLKFDHTTTLDDVVSFVTATGWKHELTLIKHFSHVSWFKHGDAEMALSLYEVEDVETKIVHRMMEIEVEKGSEVSEAEALSILNTWCKALSDDFQLGEPLSDSLYEIFSGRRYEMAPRA